MRAAVFHGQGKPLEIQETPRPSPGDGEILVKVAACGLCHTDLHYLDHGVPTFKPPPLILGHEASGTVAVLGKGVKNFREGDRVLIPAVLSCGRCFYCRTGRENICETMTMFGNNVDGAYAEYVVAPAKDCFSLPGEIPLEEACIIADAISTPYHAVKNRGRVRPGDTVAVFGCGGVGMNAVQCAAACGASVIAVDLSDRKLEWATQMGATATVNPSKLERVDKEIKKITGGGVDVAFEAIGNPVTIRAAYDSIRKGGRLCVIGYSSADVTIPFSRLMYYELEVVGSLGCRAVDYPRIIEMVRAGKIKLIPIVTRKVALEKINEGFDLMRKGEGLRTIMLPDGRTT